ERYHERMRITRAQPAVRLRQAGAVPLNWFHAEIAREGIFGGDSQQADDIVQKVFGDVIVQPCVCAKTCRNEHSRWVFRHVDFDLALRVFDIKPCRTISSAERSRVSRCPVSV